MQNETLRKTMLFDYYGELLTEKQRLYYDLHYNEDYSLAEIAERSGTSRQAVWDIIRRAEQTLSEFEEKTGLIRRADERRQELGRIGSELARLKAMTTGEAQELCGQIIDRLSRLD